MSERPRYRPGRNIAMKVPAHQWQAVVRFYEEVLGFERHSENGQTVFAFGPMTLWIDRMDDRTHAEVWLEVLTDDTAKAAAHLAAAGVVRCDAVEALPAGLDAFWIANPAGIVHLVDAGEGLQAES